MSSRAKPNGGDAHDKLKTRVQHRVTDTRLALEKWTTVERPRRPIIDVAIRLYERDRDVDNSVIGAAVALRVFLFFIPLLLFVVGLAGFLGDHLSSQDASKQAGVTGGLASQIDTALNQSPGSRWTALVFGLWGGVWAGRTLSKTLGVASRRAWQLPATTKPATVRVAGAVAGLIAAVGLLTAIANRIREAHGVALSATTLILCAVGYAVAWFFVSLCLPRARSDPTALLPGALLVGAALGALQAIVQIYLPSRVSHASQLYGAIGITIVTLGWFFIIGRLMVGSFVLNAVLWERFGSLTDFVFRMPVVRRTPERWRRRLGQVGDDVPRTGDAVEEHPQ
jgi:membrane protein